MSQWFEIGGPGTSFTTYDGVVKGKINKTTFTEAATNADIPYTESTVTYTTLDYCNEKIQFKCEFTVAGKQYTSLDKAEEGRNGYCESALRPMYIEQAFDKRIPVGETTTFDFDLNYWKASMRVSLTRSSTAMRTTPGLRSAATPLCSRLAPSMSRPRFLILMRPRLAIVLLACCLLESSERFARVRYLYHA